MQAPQSNAFVLQNSALEAFLYADVGAEANGSTLTILSILARLGKDPWVEAARWSSLPKAAVIESLAKSIAEMPLAPAALAGARDSAARLVQLLPTNTKSVRQGIAAKSATPNVVPMIVMYFAFTVGMALNLLLVPKPSSDVPASLAQSTTTPRAVHQETNLLSSRAAIASSPVVAGRQ